MPKKLTDDDIVEIGEAAQQYMRHLAKLSPTELASALGLPESTSQGQLFASEHAAIDTLQRYFMLGQAIVEGKRATRDILIGNVLGIAGGAAAGMSADKMNFLMQSFSSLRPDTIVEGFYKSKKGYAISCGFVGKCTVVTPSRVVIVKP